jgi:hypothetical protein
MTRIAILDDWQDIARSSADRTALAARAGSIDVNGGRMMP